MPSTPRRTRIELRGAVWIALAAFLVIAVSATKADPDLWGHVLFGLDWLRDRSWPRVDPYSFTQDRPWINHEWLSEAMMAAAFAAAGTAGLVLLKLALAVASTVLLYRALRGASPLVCAATIVVGVTGALPVLITLRPQLWSLLGLTVLMTMLNAGAPSARRGLAYAALFAVWANTHGGWITGLAVLGTYATVRCCRRPNELMSWTTALAASTLGTLINPYGTGLWRFLATTVRASRPDITEWRPFGFDQPLILWWGLLAPLVVALVLTVRRGWRPPAERVAVVVLLFVAGLRVSRVAPLACLPALTLLAPSIHDAWGQRWRILVRDRAFAWMVLAACAAAGIAAAIAPITAAFQCISAKAEWEADRTAAAALAGRSGRLWTTFDWGEYAIWHFAPGLRVSVDGRRETVYSDDVIEWHRAALRGDDAALRRLDAAGPDYVWLRSSAHGAREWLAANGYRIDIETPDSFIAVRAERERLTPQPPLSACFP